MLSIHKRHLPVTIFVVGTLVSTALVIMELTLMNPPQCPSYTEPQNGECIIGANIGLGLYLFATIGVWIITTIISTVLAVQNILARKGTDKKQLIASSVALVTIVSAAIYLSVAFFLNHISRFIQQ